MVQVDLEIAEVLVTLEVVEEMAVAEENKFRQIIFFNRNNSLFLQYRIRNFLFYEIQSRPIK